MQNQFNQTSWNKLAVGSRDNSSDNGRYMLGALWCRGPGIDNGQWGNIILPATLKFEMHRRLVRPVDGGIIGVGIHNLSMDPFVGRSRVGRRSRLVRLVRTRS